MPKLKGGDPASPNTTLTIGHYPQEGYIFIIYNPIHFIVHIRVLPFFALCWYGQRIVT